MSVDIDYADPALAAQCQRARAFGVVVQISRGFDVALTLRAIKGDQQRVAQYDWKGETPPNVTRFIADHLADFLDALKVPDMDGVIPDGKKAPRGEWKYDGKRHENRGE